jgi:sulfopyruvate decarboxylase TPP-binding subunit
MAAAHIESEDLVTDYIVKDGICGGFHMKGQYHMQMAWNVGIGHMARRLASVT